MDEIINISVNGNSLKKDYNCAGVQGESNSTKLRITFSQNWDGYGKIITFWNAFGQNPVQIQIGSNLLENIEVSQRIYIVPIPGEAMTASGENTFVIQGYIEGRIRRTVEGKLKVLPSRQADNAGEPEDPTPTQAEQLRTELDAILNDIASAKAGAEAAEKAETSATEAKEAAGTATEAKEAIDKLTVSSKTLEAGAGATVEKTLIDGVYNFHFGIPTGNSGVHMGTEAPTDENAKVWVDESGAYEDYATRGELKQLEKAIQDSAYDLSMLMAENSDSFHRHITAQNPHGITQSDVGLSNIDNTADADKPVSTAQAQAIESAKAEAVSQALSKISVVEGPQGEKGDPGYTPQRGTDYWTEADKAEIKGYVDDAILGGAW